MITLHTGTASGMPIDSHSAVDAHLREVAARLKSPTLVTLRSEDQTLRIGLGSADGYSVALFLDRSGDPWHAVGGSTDSRPPALEFESDGATYSFDCELGIAETDAWSAARQFVETEAKPDVLEWRREQPR